MALNDIFALQVVGLVHGQTTMNVLHYRQSTANNVSPAQFVAGWRTAHETKYLACCSDEFEITGYGFQKIAPGFPTAPYVQPVAFSPGTAGVNSLPTSVSAVITKRTALGGKANRGRIYIPAIATVMEDNSRLTIGGLGTMQSLGTQLATPFTAGADTIMAPVIYHRVSKTSTDIDNCLARSVLRTQRRRQVGVGI